MNTFGRVVGIICVGCSLLLQLGCIRTANVRRMMKRPLPVPASRPAVRPSSQPSSQPVSRPVSRPVVSTRSRPVQRKAPQAVRSIWKLYLPDKPSFRSLMEKYKQRRWSFLRSVLERRGLVEPMVRSIMAKHKMPWELVLLAGIESSYRSRARSWAGAAGMWQFIPTTGKEYGLRRSAWVDERLNPRKATVAAARFLKSMQAEFRSWEWTLAGYNCGAGCVKRVRRRCPGLTFWQARKKEACGLPEETQHYVARFFAALYYLRHPPKGEELKTLPPRRYLRFRLRRSRSLMEVAAGLGVRSAKIRAWNPSLRSWATPPGRSFVLRIPLEHRRSMRRWLQRKRQPIGILTVTSSRGLRRAARRLNLSEGFLRSLNHLPRRKWIRGRRSLLYPRPPRGGRWSHRDHKRLERFVRSALRHSRSLRRWYAKARKRPRRRRRLCHKVRAGDTYWHISRHYGVKVRQLRRYNRRRRLRPGRYLRLSRQARCSAQARRRLRLRRRRLLRKWSKGYQLFYRVPRIPRRGSTKRSAKGCYLVKRGDTFWRIARRYKRKVSELIRWNARYRRSLRPGVWLRLRPRARCPRRARNGAS